MIEIILTELAIPTLLGCLGWSFSEYAMHHWNGHLMRGRTTFSREHLRHHAEKDYFTPNRQKVTMAIAPVLVIALVGTLLFGVGQAMAFTLGFTATYIIYEVTHYRMHTVPPRGPYGRMIRRLHFAHHFNSARMNHGVTSPLWDYVFRTWEEPAIVRVPRRFAMDWLLDPETNEVREKYRADYALRTKRARATDEDKSTENLMATAA